MRVFVHDTASVGRKNLPFNDHGQLVPRGCDDLLGLIVAESEDVLTGDLDEVIA